MVFVITLGIAVPKMIVELVINVLVGLGCQLVVAGVQWLAVGAATLRKRHKQPIRLWKKLMQRAEFITYAWMKIKV
jgi:hypothetical protein